MQRSIKFRAKGIDGQWHFGTNEAEGGATNTTYLDKFFMLIRDGQLLEDTLGQYTGLPDKNGIEIYEGDKVKRVQNRGKETTHTIVFTDYRFAYTSKYNQSIALNKVVSQHQSLEVIGNIWETPELIKESNEDSG